MNLFQPEFETQKEQCPICPKWSNSAGNVITHISKEHSQKSAPPKEELADHNIPFVIENGQEESVCTRKEINESMILPTLLNNNQQISKYFIGKSLSKKLSKSHEVVKKLTKSDHYYHETIEDENVSDPLAITTNIIKDIGHTLTMDWNDSLPDDLKKENNQSICLNVNKDVNLRLDKRNENAATKESCKTTDDLIFVESQCIGDSKDNIENKNSSVNLKCDTVTNNYEVGYVPSLGSKVALAVQQLDTDNFFIDLSGEEGEEFIDDDSNEENSCEGRNQSLFIDIINESVDRCKIDEPDKNKSTRKAYIRHTGLFTDECSSDDGSYEDDAMEDESVTITDARSSMISKLQKLDCGKSINNSLKRPGIKVYG